MGIDHEVAVCTAKVQSTDSVPLPSSSGVATMASSDLTSRVALKGQSEGQVGSDVVDVPAPLPLTIEVPRADQVGHDALGGALGDVEKVREISNANSWVTGDQEERVAVIREQPEVRDGAQGGRRRSSVVGAQLYSGAEYMFHDLRDS